jgi:hypothetical protein
MPSLSRASQVRVEKEVAGVRLRYEQQNERLQREIKELQGTQAEREARQRAAGAEDKAELDRLRFLSQRLQVRHGAHITHK